MSVHVISNKGLTSLLREYRTQGYRVEKNSEVGTLRVFKGEKEILVGIQNPCGWILRRL
jgi:hypothetical protein